MEKSKKVKTIPLNSNPELPKGEIPKKGKDSDNEPEVTRIQSYLESHYDFRNNVLAGEIQYKMKGEAEFINLNENDLLVELLQERYKVSDKLLISLLKSRFVPQYNEIEHYFNGLPDWNEQTDPDYIKQLGNYVLVAEPERFEKHFKKMLVRMVACSLGQAFNKQVFVLIGKQNDGKSTFLRFLCPPALSDRFTENYTAQNKDDEIALAQNFIINLDELAALSRDDINKIKSQISRDRIKVRPPYGRKPEVMRRIANFVGSTNNDQFLTDPTGSVRWLLFPIYGIDFTYTQKVDMDLVYSQAYTLLRSGFDYTLTIEDIEENNEANKAFQQSSVEVDLVQHYFEPDPKRLPENFRTATQIVQHLLTKTTLKTNYVTIGKACTYLGFNREKRRIGLATPYGYYLKEIDQSIQIENEVATLTTPF
jgi:predicted P-loop ATPase